MAAEPLSPADRSALQAERGPINMAVAAPLVFEARAGTTYDAVARRVAARLHLIPRYRQRLEDPAFGMANPVWVDDEGFDLHWHLRHAPAAVAEPRRARRLCRARDVAAAGPLPAAVGAARGRRAPGRARRAAAEDAPRAGGRDGGDRDRHGAAGSDARADGHPAAGGALDPAHVRPPPPPRPARGDAADARAEGARRLDAAGAGHVAAPGRGELRKATSWPPSSPASVRRRR